MPNTPYTAFCNQCYDLAKRMHEFATKSVAPKMLALLDDKSRRDAVEIEVRRTAKEKVG